MDAWKAAVFAVVLVLFGACDSANPEDDEGGAPTGDPREEVEAHVATFLAEADARGQTASLFHPSRLDIILQDSVEVDGESLCGYGGATDEDVPEIYVAVNESCWHDRTEWDREILVFHELGHALLGRGHTDRTLPNGLRGSIMVAGHIFGLYSEARSHWRPFYVDELFDPNTADPDWAFE